MAKKLIYIIKNKWNKYIDFTQYTYKNNLFDVLK